MRWASFPAPWRRPLEFGAAEDGAGLRGRGSKSWRRAEQVWKVNVYDHA